MTRIGFVLAIVCVMAVAGSAGAADPVQQVEPPAPQTTLLDRPAAAEVGVDGRTIEGTSDQIELIRLDNTGVVSWRFLNPRRPVFVPRPDGVEIKNDTADRTFSILVPVAVKTSDAEYKYPTLMRSTRVLLDREDRIAALNEEIIKDAGGGLQPLDPRDVEGTLNTMDRLLRVREVLIGADVASTLTKLGDTALVDQVALEAAVRKPYTDRRQELLNREKELLRYVGSRFAYAAPAAVPAEVTYVEQRIAALEAAAGPVDPRVPDPLVPEYEQLAQTTPAAFAAAVANVETAIANHEKNLAPAATQDARDKARAALPALYATSTRLRRAQAEVQPVPAPPPALAAEARPERQPLNDELQLVRGELAMLDGDRPLVDLAIESVVRRLHAMPSPHDPRTKGGVGTSERARNALDAVAFELEQEIKTRREARIAAFDKKVEELRASWRRRSRMFTRRDEQSDLEGHVRRADALLELLDFHGKTDVNSSLGARFGGAILRNCSDDGSTYACSAVRLLSPGETTSYSSGFLDSIGSGLIKFTVRFFDEAEEPANAEAYITRVEKFTPPKNEFSWGLTGGVGWDRDPAVKGRPPVPPETTPAPGAPADCPLLVCVDGHKNHFTGSGRLDLKQRIQNYMDAQGSLSFKKGDLGQTEDKLLFSKYQFNIYGESGIAVQFGKFDFAAPTSGIAISESGEGFRVRASLGSLYALVQPAKAAADEALRRRERRRPGRVASMFAGVSYLMRRESESGAADRTNLDSNAYLLELNNLVFTTDGPFRSMNFFHVRGSNETPILPSEEAEPETFTRAPYEFMTTGAELRYAIPSMKVNGTVGFYDSRRDAEDDDVPCAPQSPPTQNAPCNGEGNVWLATATRSFSIDPKGKALRSVAFTVGQGSGDDAETTFVDEGYVGETGGYKPDLIFLNALATPFNSFERKYSDVPPAISPFVLGAGLSNKRYWSARYTDNSKNLAPQFWIVRKIFDVSEDDISGYSTILTYHHYTLRQPFAGERGLGQELDAEFQIESPKGVKSSLKAGYFRPEGAAERFVRHGIWSITMNISLSI
jgi:hypothetical protein